MNKVQYSFAIILIASGLVIGAGILVHALYYAPEKEVDAANPPFFLATSTYPTQITIPAVGVDAKVEEVGLTYIGNMGTPKFLADTGWYKYGTLPGENGSAVIDGHVDNGLGLAGVFKNLKKVKIGDDIYVTADDDRTLHFSVIDVETYYYMSMPLTFIFNRTGGAYLNLITCDGNWIPEAKTDDHRIVVYAKLIS